MHSKILSYSFVGIWQKGLPHIPVLDQKFCQELFNDPVHTINTLTVDGFMISKQLGTLPFPTVLLHPLRLQVTSQDQKELFSTVEKLRVFCEEVGIEFKFSSFGINTEIEVNELSMSSTEWIDSKFFNILQNGNSKVSRAEVMFEVILNQIGIFNVVIQPRVHSTNSIYIKANEHFTHPTDYPLLTKWLEEVFETSIEKVKSEIFIKILNL